MNVIIVLINWTSKKGMGAETDDLVWPKTSQSILAKFNLHYPEQGLFLISSNDYSGSGMDLKTTQLVLGQTQRAHWSPVRAQCLWKSL